jgi:hypothetical protein
MRIKPRAPTLIQRGVWVFTLMAALACEGSLDVPNPNEPDNKRALADPTAVEAVAAGSMRTWFNAWTSLRGATTLDAQARTHSSSWNNGNMNFYSGLYDANGVRIGPADTAMSPLLWTRTGAPWQNDPAAAARTSVDAFWGGGLDESGISRPGYYAVLSAANDALIAIRTNGVIITDAATTKRAETIAQLMQGAALMGIALNFDKGYVVDETTDLATLTYSDRKALRDAAVAKLNAAHALAVANPFTTDPSWGNGIAYSNVQIGQIAKTMVAMTLAYYARDNVEAAAVDWAAVSAAAAQGISAGSSVDFSFIGDGCVAWCHEQLTWMDAIDTGRLWTRVAYLLDPATQRDPYPLNVGNPQPASADKRVGDGSFGNAGMTAGFGTTPKTVGGGTDFAWSSQAIFRPDRGYYHQSNIGYVRYDASGTHSPTGIYFGFGYSPAIGATVNDLLWAEALLRQGGAANIAAASVLIDKSRVARGGLPPAVGTATLGAPSDGPCTSAGTLAKDNSACTLWSKLLYESEIELLGLGALPYFNQRHLPNVQSTVVVNGNKLRWIQGLLSGTPREMPVPYKELGVKGEGLYTFGGASLANSPTPP